jgi:outer membrane protein
MATVHAFAVTLSFYVQTVLQHSPALKADAKTLNAKVAKADEAYATLLPKIGLVASANTGEYTVNSISDGSRGDNVAAVINQPLINMEGAGMVRAARMAKYMAALQYYVSYQDAIKKAAKVYFEGLKAYQLSRLAAVNVVMLDMAKSQASLAYKQDVLPKSQYAFADASYQEAKAADFSARALFSVSKEAISVMAGRHVNNLTRLKSAVQLHLPVLPSECILQQRAQHHNLYLRLALANSAFVHGDLLALALGRLPTLEAYAAYEHIFSRGMYTIGTHVGNFSESGTSHVHGSMIGLKLSWPIFEGGYAINKIRNAKYRYEAAQKKIDDVRQEVDLGVTKYYMKTLADRQSIDADYAGIKSNVIARNILAMQFKEGDKSIFDFLQVQTKLVKSKDGLVKAKVAYFEDYINLEEVVGNLNNHTLRKLQTYFKRHSTITW